MRRISIFPISVALLLGITGCGSSDSSPSPQKIKESQDSVVQKISLVLKPGLPNWNCDYNDPSYIEAAKSYEERIKLLMTNCVWAFGDTTVKAVVRGISTESELLQVAETTGAFSASDVAKMMATRGIDGVQSTSNGITSWSVNSGSLTLIVDIPLLISA